MEVQIILSNTKFRTLYVLRIIIQNGVVNFMKNAELNQLIRKHNNKLRDLRTTTQTVAAYEPIDHQSCRRMQTGNVAHTLVKDFQIHRRQAGMVYTPLLT